MYFSNKKMQETGNQVRLPKLPMLSARIKKMMKTAEPHVEQQRHERD